MNRLSNVGKQVQYLCLKQARDTGMRFTETFDRKTSATITSGEYLLEFHPDTLKTVIRRGDEFVNDEFDSYQDLVTHTTAFAMNAEWVWNLYKENCDV